MPRRKRSGRLRAPPSDYTKIIFEINDFTQKYSMINFHPGQTEGRVTEQEVKEVIDAINACADTIPSGSGAPTKIAALVTGICLAILIGVALIYLIGGLIAPNAFFGGAGITIFILCFCCLLAPAVSLIWFGVIIGVFIGQAQKRFGLIVDRKLQILQDYNQRIFASKEITWLLGTGSYWLQMNLDFARNQPPPYMATPNGGQYQQQMNHAPMNNWGPQGQVANNQVAPPFAPAQF